MEHTSRFLHTLAAVAFILGTYLFVVAVSAQSEKSRMPDAGLFVPTNPADVVTISQPVTALMCGDTMLDRNVRKNILKYGEEYPFSEIKSTFAGNDLVVANLEGPFTEFDSKTIGGSGLLQFTFDPSMARVLKSVGFTTLSLANNHAYDFGIEGFAQSKSYLDSAGLHYFGHPINSENLSFTETVRGRQIAFVGFHEFSYKNTSKVLQEIIRLKQEGAFVIVYPHWGTEYVFAPTRNQISLARQFVDAGADAVVGAHPHVIESIEIYKDKPIFYSLGNFLFDQAFSEAVTQGMCVRLSLSETNAEYELSFVEIKNSQTKPLSEALSEKLRVKLSDSLRFGTSSETLGGSVDIREGITQGKFSLPL